jgi:hypothetical protein
MTSLRTGLYVLLAGWGLMTMQVFADELPAAVQQLLSAAGAVDYAVKADYGAGIEDMYIGYDAQGEAVVGVAERMTKTYKKVTTLVAVTPEDEGYAISAAEVPDMDKLPGKSRDYVKDALKDITGKVFPDAAQAKGLVDAVSGATKYYKAIYISYSLMASRIISELETGPDWERKPVPVS